MSDIDYDFDIILLPWNKSELNPYYSDSVIASGTLYIKNGSGTQFKRWPYNYNVCDKHFVYFLYKVTLLSRETKVTSRMVRNQYISL